MEVKVGDPNTTINGRHRYLLDYELPRDVLLDAADTLAWDAVGTKWTVDIQRAEVHIVAPWELEGATCTSGPRAATGGCELREVEPGHLVTEVEDLDPGEGVTVRAERGAALAATPERAPAADDGAARSGRRPAACRPSRPPPPAWAARCPPRSLVRRSGRERVGTGGVADAAFAGGGAPAGEVRLDEADLAEMATTDFAPPTELTPAQGGLLHAENVRPAHKVAWLIQAAIDGEIDLIEEDGKQVRLVRKGQLSGPLATAFGGRDEVELGSYDSTFASGWGQIDDQLQAWSLTSGLWDPLADRRKTARPGPRRAGDARRRRRSRSSAGSRRAGGARGGWWSSSSASLLGGGGFAALLRGWELRVRTPLRVRPVAARRVVPPVPPRVGDVPRRGGRQAGRPAGVHGLGRGPGRDRPVGAGRGRLHHDPAGRRARLRPHGPDARPAPPRRRPPPRRRAAAAGGGGGSVGGGGGGGGGGSW